MKVLLINPVNIADIPTTISADAALRLQNFILQAGCQLTTLFGLQAERILMWTATRRRFDFIIYFGHGAPAKWYGSNLLFPMLTKGEAHWVRGAICYTMSCSSGAELGPLMVKKGARAFIGNTAPMYAAFPEVEHNYLADFVAAWQVEPKALLQGTNVQQAYILGLQRWDSLIRIYRSNINTWNNADWYLEAAMQNRMFHILLGDKNARLQ